MSFYQYVRMYKKKITAKIPITTTMYPEIYKWIRSQTSVTNWIETTAREMANLKIRPLEIKDMQHRLKFFASQVVEQQARIDELKKETEMLKVSRDIHRRKIKEIGGKNGKAKRN